MRSLTAMAPSLTQGKEPEAACCMRPCPHDGLPIIGRIPGTANAFVAAGNNCWGISQAVRAFFGGFDSLGRWVALCHAFGGRDAAPPDHLPTNTHAHTRN